jgi:hypothetical protein
MCDLAAALATGRSRARSPLRSSRRDVAAPSRNLRGRWISRARRAAPRSERPRDFARPRFAFTVRIAAAVAIADRLHRVGHDSVSAMYAIRRHARVRIIRRGLWLDPEGATATAGTAATHRCGRRRDRRHADTATAADRRRAAACARARCRATEARKACDAHRGQDDGDRRRDRDQVHREQSQASRRPGSRARHVDLRGRRPAAGARFDRRWSRGRARQRNRAARVPPRRLRHVRGDARGEAGAEAARRRCVRRARPQGCDRARVARQCARPVERARHRRGPAARAGPVTAARIRAACGFPRLSSRAARGRDR